MNIFAWRAGKNAARVEKQQQDITQARQVTITVQRMMQAEAPDKPATTEALLARLDREDV